MFKKLNFVQQLQVLYEGVIHFAEQKGFGELSQWFDSKAGELLGTVEQDLTGAQPSPSDMGGSAPMASLTPTDQSPPPTSPVSTVTVQPSAPETPDTPPEGAVDDSVVPGAPVAQVDAQQYADFLAYKAQQEATPEAPSA